jgi:hypothetical protein
MCFCGQVENVFRADPVTASKEPCQLRAPDGQPEIIIRAESRFWPKAINLTGVVSKSAVIFHFAGFVWRAESFFVLE